MRLRENYYRVILQYTRSLRKMAGYLDNRIIRDRSKVSSLYSICNQYLVIYTQYIQHPILGQVVYIIIYSSSVRHHMTLV